MADRNTSGTAVILFGLVCEVALEKSRIVFVMSWYLRY